MYSERYSLRGRQAHGRRRARRRASAREALFTSDVNRTGTLGSPRYKGFADPRQKMATNSLLYAFEIPTADPEPSEICGHNPRACRRR